MTGVFAVGAITELKEGFPRLKDASNGENLAL
jgi:hypothetical protein